MVQIAPSQPYASLPLWRHGRFKFRFARSKWLATCLDYYAAAGWYEQLSRLSDAELARRGLSRDSLARDICATCDRETPGSEL